MSNVIFNSSQPLASSMQSKSDLINSKQMSIVHLGVLFNIFRLHKFDKLILVE